MKQFKLMELRHTDHALGMPVNGIVLVEDKPNEKQVITMRFEVGSIAENWAITQYFYSRKPIELVFSGDDGRTSIRWIMADYKPVQLRTVQMHPLVVEVEVETALPDYVLGNKEDVGEPEAASTTMMGVITPPDIEVVHIEGEETTEDAIPPI